MQNCAAIIRKAVLLIAILQSTTGFHQTHRSSWKIKDDCDLEQVDKFTLHVSSRNTVEVYFSVKNGTKLAVSSVDREFEETIGSCLRKILRQIKSEAKIMNIDLPAPSRLEPDLTRWILGNLNDTLVYSSTLAMVNGIVFGNVPKVIQFGYKLPEYEDMPRVPTILFPVEYLRQFRQRFSMLSDGDQFEMMVGDIDQIEQIDANLECESFHIQLHLRNGSTLTIGDESSDLHKEAAAQFLTLMLTLYDEIAFVVGIPDAPLSSVEDTWSWFVENGPLFKLQLGPSKLVVNSVVLYPHDEKRKSGPANAIRSLESIFGVDPTWENLSSVNATMKNGALQVEISFKNGKQVMVKNETDSTWKVYASGILKRMLEYAKEDLDIPHSPDVSKKECSNVWNPLASNGMPVSLDFHLYDVFCSINIF